MEPREGMAQVNVTIAGKVYRMACDDGEEERLTELAATLDRSIGALRQRFGEIGEQRLTVMAAITLADHQAEAERRLADAEARIAALEATSANRDARRTSVDAELAAAIAALADRVSAAATRVARNGKGRKEKGR